MFPPTSLNERIATFLAEMVKRKVSALFVHPSLAKKIQAGP